MACRRVWLVPAMAAVALLTALGGRASGEGLFESAVQERDIDFKACRAWRDGRPVAAPGVADVLGVLGLKRGQSGEGWSVGSSSRQGTKARFLVVFKAPVAMGSVMVDQGGTLLMLKSDVSDAPDPDAAAQWVPATPPEHQGGLALVTFEPGYKCRAILYERRYDRGEPSLTVLRVLRKRLFNLTPEAVANADSEYTLWPEMGPPRTFPASAITRGSGHWQNTGQNKQKRIPSPPISDVSPSWFVLSWKKEQTISGLYMSDNIETFELQRFDSPLAINPVAAVGEEWKRIRDVEQTRMGGRWVSFEPVRTRGLRIRILKVDQRDPQIARISAIHVLRDLGSAPVPKPEAAEPNPPTELVYQLPADGIVSIVVNDEKGARVRNLVARVARTAGANTDYWDLKSGQGVYVPPGTYTWTVLYHPPLGLSYEMTPYPNVMENAPDNTPWLNGVSGSGGWLADHSSNRCVAAAGDRVFIGAPCAESGVALIECDLAGKKLWGRHNFIAWTGPTWLAVDGGTLYAAAPGDHIWSVDIGSKQSDTVLEVSSSNARKRGLRGLEARDGMLYMSVGSPIDYLAGAATDDDADIDQCLPQYARKTERASRYDSDKREDYLRLFRLMGTPPGQNGLFTLSSTEGVSSRQHILLAFNKPVALGSLVFPFPEQKDIELQLSVLKPDAKYPPDVRDEKQWQTFWKGSKPGWCVAAAPENCRTRALRITFVKGGGMAGEVEAIEEGDTTADLLKSEVRDTGGRGNKETWGGTIEGMKLLRRRFESLLPVTKVVVNSGRINALGEWDAQRKRPLSPSDPGIYVMEFDKPQPVRGLAIKEIDGKTTRIDVYTGPDTGKIEISGQDGWEQVATYNQQRRYYYQPDMNHNSRARYMDGYVDFGKECVTRAVRLRIEEQWVSRESGRAGLYGVRFDRGGMDQDPSRCRVYGVAAVKYIGGEPPVEPLVYQRIEQYDVKARKTAAEMYVEWPGDLAFDPSGRLYAISGRKVVRVDLAAKKLTDFITDLEKPLALTFDSKGAAYVFDGSPDRKVVRVYDAQGVYQRQIGKAGGYQTGPWDPARFCESDRVAVDMAVDQQDQLWIVEAGFHPKRTSVWTTSGKFIRDLLGNTAYGGGGCLDPWDKTRLFYGPMEFELDWKTRETRLKNITWLGDSPAGEMPIRIGDRTYLVTRPMFGRQECGVVYLYEKDHLRRVAAMGLANFFDPLRKREIITALGNSVLADYEFIWADLNGDGDAQLNEVTFAPRQIKNVGRFDETLALDAGTARYTVKEYRPDGVPVYQVERRAWGKEGEFGIRLEDSNYFFVGGSSDDVKAPDGRVLAAYRTEGTGVHALYRASPWNSAQVVAEFDIIGKERAHAGDLGEFLMTNTNVGTWHIWTADGILAAQVFRDIRDPHHRSWSMTENQRGLRLDDCTAGQEHFSGYFCRSRADNKYYVVAGHNHASVVEVLGLDSFKRIHGTTRVTPESLAAAAEWERGRQQEIAYRAAHVMDCSPLQIKVVVDGDAGEWNFDSATMADDDLRFRMAYDADNLYLCYDVRNHGPMKNTGNDWRRYFKTGASVDLQMGTDPAADPNRKSAVAGDFRLLMTVAEGKPVAVLYRPLAPGAPKSEALDIHTMVFRAEFDQVIKLSRARLACASHDNGYVFEASIPLKELGLVIKKDTRMKIDWGVLETDEDGNDVLRRLYWANKLTAILSDEAAEALLHPDLWGFVRFTEPRSLVKEATSGLIEGTQKENKEFEDIVDELK